MEKEVLVFLGKPGAGKGTAIKLLQGMITKLTVPVGPLPVFRFSDPINTCLEALYISKTRPNQQKFSTVNRDAFGQDLLNNILYQRAVEADSPVVFVDGARRPADIAKLSKLPGFHLVFVMAPSKMRWTRIRARNDRPGDARLSWKQFELQDNAETEQCIDKLGLSADFIIYNIGTYEDLSKSVHAIASTLWPA